MSFLEAALNLARQGFHVFPLIPNSKKPLIPDFPNAATTNIDQIRNWWTDPVLGVEKPYNPGISTTRFSTKQSLLCVDIDNKNAKKGGEKLLALEMQGFEFPATLKQVTPTLGEHLIYWTEEPVKQGVDVFEEGLDVRGKGGFIVGAGSVIDGQMYKMLKCPIVRAPKWMVDRCGAPLLKSELSLEIPQNIDEPTAVKRAIHYLENEAPLSVKGHGGDATAYQVAAKVKDFGVSPQICLELMLTYWNERCPPGWSADRLKEKVDHAYRYGVEPIGVSAPENQFEKIEQEPEKLHPFHELNKEYSFVIAGGGSHILWQTTGPKGEYRLEHLAIQAFHQKLASQMLMLDSGQNKSLSELWMKSKERKSYDGICFMPGLKAPERFYNLWRGFAVEPATQETKPTPEAKQSLEMFLSHARENVCRGDPRLYKWLMGFFAHLVQKPWEKPLVALVFRGGKGVGKNALIDRIGHLLGSHYLLSSNRRYLVGNFNGFLENLLLFTLDEAFWSGDKQAEGVLKDLITGKTHVIEHKGKETYSVDNCTRVVIIGNEDWLVPATQDERRFAVFDVGDAKKQNRNFFKTMREGMERGGDALLLRFLLDYDLTGIDLNQAPQTQGLMDQKIASLDPFHQWWFECLIEGKLVSGDFGGEWAVEVDKERFRQAYRRYVRERNIRGRISQDRTLGRMLSSCLPSVDASGKKKEGSERINIYRFPVLEQARKEWETYIGHEVEWDE